MSISSIKIDKFYTSILQKYIDNKFFITQKAAFTECVLFTTRELEKGGLMQFIKPDLTNRLTGEKTQIGLNEKLAELLDGMDDGFLTKGRSSAARFAIVFYDLGNEQYIL